MQLETVPDDVERCHGGDPFHPVCWAETFNVLNARTRQTADVLVLIRTPVVASGPRAKRELPRYATAYERLKGFINGRETNVRHMIPHRDKEVVGRWVARRTGEYVIDRSSLGREPMASGFEGTSEFLRGSDLGRWLLTAHRDFTS